MSFTIPTVAEKAVPQSRAAYLKAWREANRGKVKGYSAKSRLLRKTDPLKAEKERARQRRLKSKDPVRRLERGRLFHKKNPGYRAAWRQEAFKNPAYVILNRVRSRLHGVLTGTKRDARTMELLGCNVAQFLAHIEGQFLPGMSWENRQLWHLDHRTPCAAFDLTQRAQLAACFHYTNYQPLWALDNMRKGAKH